MLPRDSLVTIYISFFRPHLDCGYIIINAIINNKASCNLNEKVNTALAITAAIIKGTSQLKTLEELGLESLKFRRSFRRFCVFYL